MLEIVESHTSPARIKVFGVGGGGSNAVNRMIQAGLAGVEFWVANTDLQALEKSPCPNRLQIGKAVTRGLGAGGDPEIGRISGEESRDAIAEALHGADMLFVTAGMGGGTGTGAAPVVAGIAKDLGVLTVAIVTKPFTFEGKKKMARAVLGVEKLSGCVDTLIAIPNQKLLSIVAPGTPLHEALLTADEVLFQATRGISDLITGHGLINLDFADINAVMRNRGNALLGCGAASGKDRAVEAAQAAVSSPLLEEVSIMGAEAVLINVHGGLGLGLHEAAEAAEFIQSRVGDEADIFLGAVIDPSLEDEIRVTLIATGFDGNRASQVRPVAAESGVSAKADAPYCTSGVPLRLHSYRSFRSDEVEVECGSLLDGPARDAGSITTRVPVLGATAMEHRAGAVSRDELKRDGAANEPGTGPDRSSKREAGSTYAGVDEDLLLRAWSRESDTDSGLFLPEEPPRRQESRLQAIEVRSSRGEAHDVSQSRSRTRPVPYGGDHLDSRLGRRNPLDEPAFMRKRMD